MKFEFNLTLPRWLHWLMPARLVADLEQRSMLTGKASKNVKPGKILDVTVSCEREQ